MLYTLQYRIHRAFWNFWLQTNAFTIVPFHFTIHLIMLDRFCHCATLSFFLTTFSGKYSILGSYISILLNLTLLSLNNVPLKLFTTTWILRCEVHHLISFSWLFQYRPNLDRIGLLSLPLLQIGMQYGGLSLSGSALLRIILDIFTLTCIVRCFNIELLPALLIGILEGCHPFEAIIWCNFIFYIAFHSAAIYSLL